MAETSKPARKKARKKSPSEVLPLDAGKPVVPPASPAGDAGSFGPQDAARSDSAQARKSLLSRLREFQVRMNARRDKGEDMFGPEYPSNRRDLNRIILNIARNRLASNKSQFRPGRSRNLELIAGAEGESPAPLVAVSGGQRRLALPNFNTPLDERQAAVSEARYRNTTAPLDRKVVVVNGKEIELPSDYRQRKRFRQLQQEELQKISGAGKKARRELAKTEWQLKGRLGRLGYKAGRAVGKSDWSFLSDMKPSARNPLVRFGIRYGRKTGGIRGNLKAAGALAGGALIGNYIASKFEESETENRLREEVQRRSRMAMLDALGRREYKQSVQQGIQDNLARLQMQAPDLYMRMAAGRILPQGAVVIGGVPRTDLLNELGMAMANGQFSQ